MAILFPNVSISSNTTSSMVEVSGGYIRNSTTYDNAFQVQTDYNTTIGTGVINWNQVGFNAGSNFATSGTGANQRFTAPFAGAYLFSAWLMSHNTAQVDISVKMRVNGSIALGKAAWWISSGNSNHHHGIVDGGQIFFLANGDYVDIEVIGGTVYGNEGRYTRFCGCYLGDY